MATININKVEIAVDGRLLIKQKVYDTFVQKFDKGDYGTKRFGEAFYEYFKLERMKDQEKMAAVFARDGKDCKDYILSVFEFTT